ncbi:MAG TPA: tetratricopeptide repeat protein, partial [Syntrophorhabdaceae bacterium]|nr:tetratricopeptide repeat protein [Syntrophorhabdaceae bacterium]
IGNISDGERSLLKAKSIDQSKVKHKEQKGTVPPNLAAFVMHASTKQRAQNKAIITAAAVAVIVLCGFGAIYFTTAYLHPAPPSPKGRTQSETVQTQAIVTAMENSDPSVPQTSAALQTSGLTRASNKESNGQLGKIISTGISDRKNQQPVSRFRTHINEAKSKRQKGAAVISESTSTAQSATGSNVVDNPAGEKDVSLYTARNYEEKGNHVQAVSHYKKALAKDPRNYLIMNSLANTLIKTGSFREAIYYSAGALEIQNNYIPSLINLGIANIQIGNISDGERSLLKAKSIDQSNRAALYNLGLLYEKNSNYQESLTMFKKLADMRDISGQLGMARIFEKQGNGADAEKLYREILSSSTTDQATKQFASERLQLIRQ